MATLPPLPQQNFLYEGSETLFPRLDCLPLPHPLDPLLLVLPLPHLHLLPVRPWLFSNQPDSTLGIPFALIRVHGSSL